MGYERKNGQSSFIYDRIYGHIEFSDNELALFQTRELTRLRQVSLSAIPSWIVPAGVCASKFEHSVGVGDLARIVGQRPEFRNDSIDLYFAALGHDLGTPPFSHATEYFMIKMFGKNHEEFIEDIIDGSDFAKVVKQQGGNVDRVVKLVEGKDKPLSDIVNGSIDIDNLDNTLRFGLSMGILRDISYSPRKIAHSFGLKNGRVVLEQGIEPDLKSWEQTRRDVYEFVYGEAHLSAGMILYRALDFARREGELDRNFFLMTDAEAFSYLLNRCNQRTKTLIDRANRWIFYPRAFNISLTAVPDEMVKFILDSDNRDIVADEVARLLKVPPEDVCVFMGKNKGFKHVHLPVVGESGEENSYQSGTELNYMAQVYVHPDLIDKAAVVTEYMNDKLAL